MPAHTCFRRALLTLAVALVAPGAPAALAVDDPGAVAAASYSFSASADPSASGSGKVTGTGMFSAVVRGSRWQPGRTLRFTAQVVSWRLDFLLPRKALVLKVRVTHGSEGCAAGTRGTVMLVDDDTPLENGASSDRVTLRFAGTACQGFAGSWTNAGDAPRARVRISLL